LATEALVLGLQVAEASLKGPAAGTRDGLHTSVIGEVLASAALPRPRSRDQHELDALKQIRPRETAHRRQPAAHPRRLGALAAAGGADLNHACLLCRQVQALPPAGCPVVLVGDDAVIATALSSKPKTGSAVPLAGLLIGQGVQVEGSQRRSRCPARDRRGSV